MQSLHAILEARAQSHPHHQALAAPDRQALTFSQLRDQVQATAAALRSSGLQKIDRIAVVLPNGPEMATAFLATACAGISAPLNPAYSEEEFKFYLQDLEAKALLTSVSYGDHHASIKAAQSLGLRILRIDLKKELESGRLSIVDAPQVNVATTAPIQPEPGDPALMLHTSGTTSKPKLVPLTHANLTASALSIAKGLGLSSTDRCLNIMPLFHVHGLLGALLSSLSAGACTVCTPGFAADAFPGWLQKLAPTWYTGVPTMHQAILSNPESYSQTSKLRFIRSCSAALPPTVMAELEARFRVPVIEAYGMTEASHQMASNPLPPGVRKPGSVGLPSLPEVAILDEQGRVIQSSPNQQGEVAIRGANVTSGYEKNQAANATSFTHGWFRTGDMGYLDADGYLFLTGRLKEIINKGGEKISPRAIDEVLLEHPAVAQAVAFGRPHVTLGEDVCAAVVLKAGAATTETELRDFTVERLAPFKVPSTILILDQIPKGPTGKVQRVGLAAKLADRFLEERIEPRNLLESLVWEIWSEILGHDAFGVRDNFFGLGGDSLKAGRILARLEETFEVSLARTLLFQRPRVEQLVQHLQGVISPETLHGLEQAMNDVMSEGRKPS